MSYIVNKTVGRMFRVGATSSSNNSNSSAAGEGVCSDSRRLSARVRREANVLIQHVRRLARMEALERKEKTLRKRKVRLTAPKLKTARVAKQTVARHVVTKARQFKLKQQRKLRGNAAVKPK